MGRPAGRQLDLRLGSEKESADIEDAQAPLPRRGFGSVRVEATTGGSRWRTSIFPDRTRGCYVLPVKRAVRRAEGLDVGEVALIRLEILQP